MAGGWSLGRRPELDGLRGVAIMLVLLRHGQVPGTESAGDVGVTLFFVLSGFLITALLLEERERAGQISLRSFYARRVRRLAPAFVVSAAVATLAGAYWSFVSLADLGWSLSYAANWRLALMAHPLGGLGGLTGTWSLAVEEQFYLVWPLALTAAICLGRRWVLGLALVGATASVAIRELLTLHHATPARIYYGTDTSAVALLLGAALAVVLVGSTVRSSSPMTAITGAVLLIVVCPMQLRAWSQAGLLAVVASVLLVWASAQREGRALSPSCLTWLGRRSYAIYLWNCIVGLALFHSTIGWPLLLPLTVLPSLLLAEASWRLVESRFMRRSPVGVPPEAEHAAASESRQLSALGS